VSFASLHHSLRQVLSREGRWPGAGLSLAVAFSVVVATCGVDVAAAAESPDPLTGLAEPPHWPIGFIPPGVEVKPDKKTGQRRAAVLAWIPPKARRIRSLLIIPANTDSKHIGEHEPIRKVAMKHEMAIVYLRNGNWPEVQEILDTLAQRSGIEEFRRAPWIVQGKSSRGMFPVQMAWLHPERTIAGITYHGETPPLPPAENAEKTSRESILWLNTNGESEWGGTWFVHVRPSLLNYRAQTAWLPHLVVVKGVGHGDYPDANGSDGWGKKFPDRITCINVWDYYAVYIDKALTLRVPRDTYPTDGPVKLLDVDASKGYLIDPFAVEDLWRKARYPLKTNDKGEYLVAEEAESPVSGFSAIAAANDFKPREDAPVQKLQLDRSPSKWLVTDSVQFAMKRDPRGNLGGWEKLRPQEGDTVDIDGTKTAFHPLPDNKVAKNGGISLQGMKKWGGAMTLLAYTVVDIPKRTHIKLIAPYSVAGRLRIVLGGQPIDHKEVVEVEKGVYPMLAVLRLDGPNWGAIDPHFVAVSDQELALAKATQQEKERRAAEEARLAAEGGRDLPPPVRPAADVPEGERKNYFWIADREQAEAWFQLHAIHGQQWEAP